MLTLVVKLAQLEVASNDRWRYLSQYLKWMLASYQNTKDLFTNLLRLMRWVTNNYSWGFIVIFWLVTILVTEFQKWLLLVHKVTLVAIECVDNCRACSLPAFNAQTCRVHCEIEMVLSCVAFQLNASVWAPLSPRRQSFKMALTSFAFYKVLYSITLIIIFPKSCLGDGSRFAFDVGLSGRGSTTSFSLSSSFNISAIRLCCEIEQWFSKLIWFPIK